jgi:hypothetical protein
MPFITDAYSEKHIAYKWKDGPRDSVGLSKNVQLPQFSIRGFRAKNKLEQLSTGLFIFPCARGLHGGLV